uniref:ABC transporter substrate-binding protein n=1 Tax=Eubacterium cellulosolvens TaxID=29322 RepID=UPI000481B952|nr:ABC transporter substrate binding protein [[Eubacterium] cellulosolvens]
MKKKRIAALFFVGILALSFAGCGKEKAEDEEAQDPGPRYTVGIVQSRDDRQSTQMTRGFRDALVATIGEKNVEIITKVDNGKVSVDKDVKDLVGQEVDLLMTNGVDALRVAANATEEIPIVGTNIVEYREVLDLGNADDEEDWDRRTRRNITGVESSPNMTDTLSLIIEATRDLESVGILYSPYDTRAVVQDERLEKLLDEAGIPWKEYVVPLSGMKAAEIGTSADNTTIQVRKVRTSYNWQGEELELPADVTTQEVVSCAAEQTSVLFISAESMLSDQARGIVEAAREAKVGLVTDDADIARYALAALFVDPYIQGYQAGLQAREILVEEKDITKMKIKRPTTSIEQKLYEQSYASLMEMEFPKSFEEATRYLTTNHVWKLTS